MGQLFIPGEKEIKGPWLIGVSELEELNEIFEFIYIKIKESATLEIEECARIDLQKGRYKDLETSIAENKKYYADKESRRVVLILSDEKRLIDSSVNGILRDSKIKDFKPRELQLEIQSRYDNKFSLNVKRRFDGEITYKVECFDPDCREEIKYKIETWLEKHQPNKAKQIWSEFAFVFIVISFLCASFSSPYMITTELPDFKTIYKNDITQIIKSGVNKENETKSIELLLKYTTDYKPDNISEVRKVNKIPIQTFSIAIFIMCVSIFKPRTTLGIGKHKTLLKFYKLYTTFVLITLPSIFFIPPIISWIRSLTGF